jgi:hypothetical protein
LLTLRIRKRSAYKATTSLLPKKSYYTIKVRLLHLRYATTSKSKKVKSKGSAIVGLSKTSSNNKKEEEDNNNNSFT